MIGEIYLGLTGAEALLTAYDRKFSKKTIELSRSERTADGTLVTDIIAIKYQFNLSYETIDESHLDYFELLYNLQQDLSLIVYSSDTNSDTYSVKMQPYDQNRLLLFGAADGGAVWQGVNIILEEI